MKRKSCDDCALCQTCFRCFTEGWTEGCKDYRFDWKRWLRLTFKRKG